MKRIIVAAILGACLVLGSASSAVKLDLPRAALNFDPNAAAWHVSARICNADHNASGELNLDLRLYDLRYSQGDIEKGGIPFKSIGHKSLSPLQPNACLDDPDIGVDIDTKKVEPGTYHIVLSVGDWDGTRWSGGTRKQIDQDFVKNSPLGGGQLGSPSSPKKAGSASLARKPLEVSRADLTFDRSWDAWRLSTKICNVDSGQSGTLGLDLRLYDLRYSPEDIQKGGIPFKSVGRKNLEPLQPGACLDDPNIVFTIETKSVEPGTYHVVLSVGDWEGTRWSGGIRRQFEKDFVKDVPLGQGQAAVSVVNEVSASPKPAEAPSGSERTFPSIFQAWSGAENLDEPPLRSLVRHDLAIVSPATMGMKWTGSYAGLSTGFDPAGIARGRATRAQLAAANPNLILLMEVRYRDAPVDYLPPDSALWARDGGSGALVPGYAIGARKYMKLDYARADLQKIAAIQCQAVVASGVFDGCFLDWWQDDAPHIAMLQKIRGLVGDGALLLVNSNDRQAPGSAAYLNGIYMEGYRSKSVEDWERLRGTLEWAEKTITNHSPRINCLETWFGTSREAPADLQKMRMTTTLVLTRSDGYALFGDPDGTGKPEHAHDWYRFWDKTLGRPLEAPERQPKDNGAWLRRFAKGTAVYNPLGNPRGTATVAFTDDRTSAATGSVGKVFTVPAGDGDLFLQR